MNPQRIIPSLGRSVHYVLPLDHPKAGEHRAAIITGVHPGAGETVCDTTQVSLTVFMDGVSPRHPGAHIIWLPDVPQSVAGLPPDTWHAPEFVDQSPLSDPRL